MNITKRVYDFEHEYRVNCFFALNREGEYLTFPNEISALCRITSDGEISSIKWLDEYDEYEPTLFYAAATAGDYVVLFPGRVRKLGLYNIRTQEFEYLDYEVVKRNSKKKFLEDNAFFYSVVNGENVFAFGATYPGILKLNVNTKEVEYITDWIEELENCLKEDNHEEYFCGQAVTMEANAYIPTSVRDIILKLQMDTGNVELIHLGEGIDSLCGMCRYKDSFVVMGLRNGKYVLFRWDPVRGFIKQMDLFDRVGDMYWWYPINIQDQIVLVPEMYDEIIKVDFEGGRYQRVSMIGKPPEICSFGRWTVFPFIIDGKLIINTHWDRKAYKYDPGSDEVEVIYLTLKDEIYDRRRWKERYLDHPGIFFDENDFPLKRFLDGIAY